MEISVHIEGIKSAGDVCKSSIVIRPPLTVRTSNTESFLQGSPGLKLNEFQFDSIEIHAIKNCFMLPTGAIITHDGWVIAETLEGSLVDNGMSTDRPLTLPINNHFKEPIYCTSKFGTFNYSVFLHEVLPAIYVAGLRPDLSSGFTLGYAAFVPQQKQDKFKELYAPFYPPAFAVNISGRTSVCSEALILSTGARRHNLQRIKRVMPPMMAEFALSLDPNIQDAPERIYVLRERKSIRELENRERIILWAHENGFVCVELADLSFSAQASYFRNASVIFAEHGAGLANLWHCRKGVKIFEIFPDKLWGRWLYRAIANLSGFEYAADMIPTGEDWIWNKDSVLLPSQTLDRGLKHFSL